MAAMVRMGGGLRLRLRSWWSTRRHNCHFSSSSNSSADDGKWLKLPPVINVNTSSSTTTTVLKWIIRCHPDIPKTLLHKLFRLRRVRMLPAAAFTTAAVEEEGKEDHKFKRVAAKDTLNSGDRIFLPHSVKQIMPHPKLDCHLTVTAKEINFIRNLVIYKDPATLVLNKPPGMPVQGGINIKRSLDVVAATSLTYDYSQPPRLVHRLDKDCSGILVMGRTQTSTALLHSIFRDKTSTANSDHYYCFACLLASSNQIKSNRLPQKRESYKESIGHWSSDVLDVQEACSLLHWVVVDNGKSDRITIVDRSTLRSSQHAITEYRVIRPSSHGYTWLELSPLTGRKHQLRVHCAEVLGTPIVGDYKYGWQAHRKCGHFDLEEEEDDTREELLLKEETLPFGLNLNKGSISGKHPRLHLHCKQIVLPNISQALQNVQSASSSCDLSVVESLDLKADLPPYMQRSWDDLTNS